MHNTKNILGTLPEMLKKLFSVTLVLFLSACDDTCPTIQDYKNEGISTVCTGCSNAEDGNCLLCSLFRIITKAASAAANMSWNTFASQLIPVVGLAAAIYIAIYVLKKRRFFYQTKCSRLFNRRQKRTSAADVQDNRYHQPIKRYMAH